MDGLVGWVCRVGRTSFSANGNGLENGHLGMSLLPSPMPIRGMRCAWLLFQNPPSFSLPLLQRVSHFSGRDREK